MEELLLPLRRCGLFRDFTEEQLAQELLPHGSVRTLPKGSYLLLPQERLDYFGIIIQGRIHTQHIFSDGSYSITDALDAGELFGADLICTRSRVSPYHAVAAEDTKLLTFPYTLTEPGLVSEPLRQGLLEGFLLLISNHNMQKEYRLAILSQKGLRERIMTYLQMQAAKRHTSTFTIPFSREELASYLCVNRSALSHELSKLQKEGLIEFRKNKFCLPELPS